jgi:hypothetical protein
VLTNGTLVDAWNLGLNPVTQSQADTIVNR